MYTEQAWLLREPLINAALCRGIPVGRSKAPFLLTLWYMPGVESYCSQAGFCKGCLIAPP